MFLLYCNGALADSTDDGVIAAPTPLRAASERYGQILAAVISFFLVLVHYSSIKQESEVFVISRNVSITKNAVTLFF